MFYPLKSTQSPDWKPLHFLSALGSGGLSISFFMYLMFWVPHKDSTIPAYAHVSEVMLSGSLPMQIGAVLGMAGIVFFGLNFIRILVWNLKSYSHFKRTEAYNELIHSNAETQLSAIPLTLAMAINVGFVLGAVFVPGLWDVREYLFPFALLAFAAVGFYAVKVYLVFWGRALKTGGFDTTKNNNLSQVLPAFSLAMVGVGFSSSAAMSSEPVTVVLGMIGAILFVTAAMILALVKLVMGFQSLFEYGAGEEGLPTLMIMIPIMTLVAITFLRISHGTEVLNGFAHADSAFLVLTILLSVQVMFGVLALFVKRRFDYFKTWIWGEKKSVVSYALVCPGVAGVIMAFFWLHKGLLTVMPIEILAKYDIAYWMLLVPVLYLQFQTIRTYMHLNRKMLKSEGAERLQTA